MDATTVFLLCLSLLMGIAFAGLIAMVALRQVGPLASTIVALGWYLCTFAPFAWRFAAPSTESFIVTLGLRERPLDYGGAVPFCIAVAAGAIAVSRFLPRASAPSRMVRSLAPLQLLLLCMVWTGWMVATEQDITPYTAVAALNSIVAVLSGVVAGILIELLRRRRSTRSAAQFGAIAGLAAATASCAYLDLVSSSVVGAIAGGVAVLIGTRKKATGSLVEAIVVPVASGAVVGLISLGLLDQTRGFFYTGQPDLTLSQFAVVCISGVVAFAFTGAVTLIARLVLLTPGAVQRGRRSR